MKVMLTINVRKIFLSVFVPNMSINSFDVLNLIFSTSSRLCDAILSFQTTFAFSVK